MDRVSNDIRWDKNRRMGAIHLEKNQREVLCTRGGLGGVTIVLAKNPSKFCRAANVAYNPWCEVSSSTELSRPILAMTIK